MEEQKSKKKLLIILLVACVLLATGLCVFFFCKKDDEVKQGIEGEEVKQGTNNNETKALYHIVDGDEATIWDSYDVNIPVSFDYPQFDIDSKEIEAINSKIKEVYQKAYNQDFGREVDQDTDIPLVIEKDGKYFCNSTVYVEESYCEFEHIIYDITESSEYLAITFTKKVDCHCGIGQDKWAYFIDKETKKVLTNSEIVKKFNKNEQSIIDEYNSYIDNIGCYDDSTKASMKAKTIDDIKFYVENNELLFIKQDNCG